MNNNKKSSTKSYIILAIVLIVAVAVYFYMQGFKEQESDTLAVSEDNNIGLQVIALLNQVKSINIDADIFSDPVYVTLMDNTVIVPVQNVGRANPFAPIPGVSNNTTKR